MEQKIISIIIPVYNTEKYLERCLESVIKQTYKNLEILVVDDCSPGNVAEMVASYGIKDKRVKYIKHDVNRGLFRARLTGAQSATGSYITFLDSDDYITVDYYHCLIKKAIEKDADIVIGKTVLEKANGERLINNLHDCCFLFEEIEGDEIKEKYFGQKGLCYSWHTVWNKIYRKDLWDKCYVYYDTIKEHLIMTEDIAFSTPMFYYAKKVATIQNEAYFYCANEDASTNVEKITINRFEKNLKDITLVFDFVESFLEQVKSETYIRECFKEFRKHYSRLWRELGENVFIGLEKKKAVKLMDEFLPNYKKYTSKDDHFFSSVTTNWNGGLEYIKQQIIESDCEYVSFDIFDTVVTRPLYNPTDLFVMLDKKFEELISMNISFSKLRMQAENGIRYKTAITHPGYQDVTIEEIYSYMKDEYNLSTEITKKMMEAEKNLELQMCTQRRATKEIYDVAMLSDKKIIFVSDMYLDEETLKKLLERNGYFGYEKLYVSSSQRLTKGNGELFKSVLEDLKVKGERVLHIGDTWQNDIINAQAHGINAIFLPKAIEVFENKIGGMTTNACGQIFNTVCSSMHNDKHIMESLGFRSMIGMIANKYFDNPYRSFNTESDFNVDPYFMGYYTLGMHMLGLAKWLAEEGSKLNYENICFMARDGYLPMRAYEEYIKLVENAPKPRYTYVSRKSVLPAMIKDKRDLYDLPIEFRNHTAKTVLSQLQFGSRAYSEQEIIKELKSAGIIYDKRFNSEHEFNHFIKYYIENIYDEQKHISALDGAKAYFGEMIGPKDATFDLGYSGRIQGAVSNLVGRPIDVFFVHQDSKRINMVKRKDKFKVFNFYDFTPYMTGLIREHVLSDTGASCIGFELKDGKGIPIFEIENKTYQDIFIVGLLQQGALDFIKDYVHILGEYTPYLEFRNQEVSLPFEGLLRNSKEIDRGIFKSSYFEDLVYGAKDNINIYDFIQEQYRSLPINTVTHESNILVNNYPDHVVMVDSLVHNRNLVIKFITYAMLDRKTLKDKVKLKLSRRPILLQICKTGYKSIKYVFKQNNLS